MSLKFVKHVNKLMFAKNKIVWRQNLDLDSRSDNVSLQRREQHVSNTHSSSFFLISSCRLYRSKSRTLIQVLILFIYSIFMESSLFRMSSLLNTLSHLMSMAKWLSYPPATLDVGGSDPRRVYFFFNI